jgi:hypothetical protein
MFIKFKVIIFVNFFAKASILEKIITFFIIYRLMCITALISLKSFKINLLIKNQGLR